MAQAEQDPRPNVAADTNQSSLNLVAFALSVGTLVFAAMTLAAPPVHVIPIITVCLTLSLLGAATKQPHALLGWVAVGLSAVALTLAVIAVVH